MSRDHNVPRSGGRLSPYLCSILLTLPIVGCSSPMDMGDQLIVEDAATVGDNAPVVTDAEADDGTKGETSDVEGSENTVATGGQSAADGASDDGDGENESGSDEVREVEALTGCEPTSPDGMGPFYEPDAPQRDVIGEGYVLSGVVRTAGTCAPVAGAMIEVWMAGPDGEYGDEWRATLFADENGGYRLETHIATPYVGRPPHHHLRVTADGFQELVTQHYPVDGDSEATADLVIESDV